MMIVIGSKSLYSVLVALLVTWCLFASCNSEQSILGVSGRNIEVHVSRPQLVSTVFYVEEGATKIITPSASNRKLAVLNVTIVNRSSTVIPISVDPEAAKLGDRRGKKSEAIDPYQRSKEISGIMEPDSDTVDISPILWGETELPREFQVSGNIVFDVPKGLLLGTMFWDEVEYIPVDFVDYWKDRD